MVEAHHALRHAQEEERLLLTSSHQQLQDLEKRRVDLIKKVVTAFLTSYRWVTCLSTAHPHLLDCSHSLLHVGPQMIPSTVKPKSTLLYRS